MKIMLVDDDRTMRSILKTLLELEQYQVAAWDGQPTTDILASIRAEKPDVVILDVFLRELSGLDVVRSLRNDPELAGIKVLMSSGMSLKDECINAGADGFLMKPYMPDELMEFIKSYSPN